MSIANSDGKMYFDLPFPLCEVQGSEASGGNSLGGVCSEDKTSSASLGYSNQHKSIWLVLFGILGISAYHFAQYRNGGFPLKTWSLVGRRGHKSDDHPLLQILKY